MHTEIEPLRANLKMIQKGLFQMGRHRIMALPAHTTWELIDDLEVRAAELMEQLDRIEAEERRETGDRRELDESSWH